MVQIYRILFIHSVDQHLEHFLVIKNSAGMNIYV